MQSQLYLDNGIRKKFIDDLTFLKELFLMKVEPVFANAEFEAEAYKRELWDSISIRSNESEDCVDLSDCSESIEEATFERYSLIHLMHYRNLAAWICTLCQVWEQQLYAFIVREAQSEGLEYNPEELGCGFAFSKRVFEWHQYPLDKMSVWDKIKELRLVVNVIKHADGKSEKRLRHIKPEIFIDEGYDLISLYHTSLLEPTLMINRQDFCEYYDALILFWKELPERMYTKELAENCEVPLFRDKKKKVRPAGRTPQKSTR